MIHLLADAPSHLMAATIQFQSGSSSLPQDMPSSHSAWSALAESILPVTALTLFFGYMGFLAWSRRKLAESLIQAGKADLIPDVWRRRRSGNPFALLAFGIASMIASVILHISPAAHCGSCAVWFLIAGIFFSLWGVAGVIFWSLNKGADKDRTPTSFS